ncbi:hypothetical protein ACDA63_07190 [Uliginosibacterium sp. sgz301328]|uniref:phage neck terminator protein n=1 Tax=Uliginosibacterium sp. sgz301328 TaxID=3243764 RepID=UPI00359EFC05
MANTSATGGPLTPAGTPAPAQDKDLDAIIQTLIKGVSGLPGNMVRPAWQGVVPKQPASDQDWCAFHISGIRADANPWIGHNGQGDGSDEYVRHEDIDVLCTFYGPNAMRNASLARDGIYVTQNSEGITSHDMAVVGSTDLTAVPEFVNQQWIRRYDLPIRLRRKVSRAYPVLNILSVPTNIVID